MDISNPLHHLDVRELTSTFITTTKQLIDPLYHLVTFNYVLYNHILLKYNTKIRQGIYSKYIPCLIPFKKYHNPQTSDIGLANPSSPSLDLPKLHA
jgi:hypothetical protein